MHCNNGGNTTNFSNYLYFYSNISSPPSGKLWEYVLLATMQHRITPPLLNEQWVDKENGQQLCHSSWPPQCIALQCCLAPIDNLVPHQWWIPKSPCVHGSHVCRFRNLSSNYMVATVYSGGYSWIFVFLSLTFLAHHWWQMPNVKLQV